MPKLRSTTKKTKPKHVLDKDLQVRLNEIPPQKIRDWLDHKLNIKITVDMRASLSVILTRVDSKEIADLCAGKKQSISSATSTPKTPNNAKRTSTRKRGNIQNDRDPDPPKTKARKVTRTKMPENSKNDLPKQKPTTALTQAQSDVDARKEITDRMIKWANSSNYGQTNTAAVTGSGSPGTVIGTETDEASTVEVTEMDVVIGTAVVTDTILAAGTDMDTNTDVVINSIKADVVTDSRDDPATVEVTDSRDDPATVEVTDSRDDLATVEVTDSRDDPATVEVTDSRDDPATVEVTDSRDDLATVEVTDSRDDLATVEVTDSRDDPATVELTDSRDDPATVEVTDSRDDPATDVVTDSRDDPATTLSTDPVGTTSTPVDPYQQKPEPIPADDDDILLRCRFCIRYFTEPRYLRMHEDTHGQRSSPRPTIIPLHWRETESDEN